MSSIFSGHTRSRSSVSIMTSPKKKKDPALSKNISGKPSMIGPSVREASFGSSIGARTAAVTSFRELGPPDLVHMSKYSKQSQKDEGEYHFVTGVDVSSSDAPIAYITTWSISHPWTSSKRPCIFTYCSYNCFSRADIRLRIEFNPTGPSEPSYYVLPADRSRKSESKVTPDLWEELFVSGVVRSIIINNDFERKLPALQENVQYQSLTAAKDIIAKLVQFLDRGSLLGADSNVQKPSIYENYLLDALYKIVEITQLYEFTIDLIEKQNRPEYEVIIIKLLLSSDSEMQAIQRVYQALKKNPRSQLLLIEQIKFLISKSKFDLALDVALYCVKIDPVNFNAWYWLVKSQILNGDISGALVSLNSAQMHPTRLKDLALVNPKDEINLPFPQTGKVASVWEDLVQVYGVASDNQVAFSPKSHVEAVDPSLLRINRTILKGTYQKTYDLVILIVNAIGWEGLLKIRSQVFLMDQEFQNESVLSLHSQLKTHELKQKRVASNWLDDLILKVYEDLKVVLIVENELANANQIKHSALEWELIGLTAYRSSHFRSASASLRTTISAKFDIIAANKLLTLWSNQKFDKEFQIWAKSNNHANTEILLDDILTILVKTISYNVRFYNEAQLDILLFLKRLFTKFDVDYIKNKVQVLFENDNNDFTNSGVIPAFDRLVASVGYLNSEEHNL